MTAAKPSGLIELRLSALDQLFDPFDPFPMPTRDLAKSAEEFVVGWARELSATAPLALRIYLPGQVAEATDAAGVRAAISGHFKYRADRVRTDMRELLGLARFTLLIGLVVLGVCIGVRYLLRDLAPESPVATFLGEGLAILGWVANWRPIEILLFEWWPLDRRRQLFTRLANAPVDIVAAADLAPEAFDDGQRIGPAPM